MGADHFGLRVRTLRKALRLTQKDLADTLGVSRSAVASYENGTRYPDYSVLLKMASFFQVSVDHLLGVDAMNKEDSVQYTLLDEIAQMLNAAPIHPDEKQKVLEEISDYFKWKLYLAQHPEKK